MHAPGPRLPIGRSGRLDALGLTAADGDHALLILDAGEPRALVSARASDGAAERLVVSGIGGPLQTESDVDALPGWLASASIGSSRAGQPVPAWASLVGLIVLLTLVAFAVIGGAVSFGWVLEALAG
jgi:hypothetical protein